MADHTDLGSGKAADAVEDGRQLRARLLGQLVAVEQEVEQEAARRHRTRRQGVAPGRLDLRAIDRCGALGAVPALPTSVAACSSLRVRLPPRFATPMAPTPPSSSPSRTKPHGKAPCRETEG